MIDRKTIDSFVAEHSLGPDGVKAALGAAQARPTRDELRGFIQALLRLAGTLSIAAGVVFFVAANWDELAIFGRFVLVETLLVVSAALALWRPSPHWLGRTSLLLAFVMTGVLCALFGQTYQTGADIYELFLTWSLLGLPFVIAAQWSVSWAAWVIVLNLSLSLFCGLRPEGGWFWFVLSGIDIELAALLLAPMMINLTLWALREHVEQTRWSDVAPSWLGRLTFACAVAFGTWAGSLAIIDDDASAATNAFVMLFVTVAFVAVGTYAVRKRVDVFPLAAIAGSAIILTTFALAEAVEFRDEGVFFVLAIWLIVSSTVSGRLLMKLVRSWTREAQA